MELGVETHEPMLYISVRHESDAIRYGNYDSYSMLMTNHDLVHEETGVSYDHLPIADYELAETVHLTYPTSDMPEGKYLFTTGTTWALQ